MPLSYAQSRGQSITRQAIKNLELIPKDACEICEKKEGSRSCSFSKPIHIVPHHYKGYDYPYDVWWICRSCNRHLIKKHDNSIKTPQDARDFIFGTSILLRLRKEYNSK